MNLIMETGHRANSTLIRFNCAEEMQRINSLLPSLKAVLGRSNTREILNVLVQKGIRQLNEMSLEELQEAGLNKEDALLLIASLELGRQSQKAMREENPQSLNTTEEAARMLLQMGMGSYDREVLVVIVLDTKNQVVDTYTAAVGALDCTHTTMRELLKESVKRSAAKVILAHNHPSGQTEPSQADIFFTDKVRNACELMGIALLDHIIIGRGCWTSIHDHIKGECLSTEKQYENQGAAELAARLLGRG